MTVLFLNACLPITVAIAMIVFEIYFLQLIEIAYVICCLQVTS